GAASIGADVKLVEDSEVPAGRQLVHRAVPERPALIRGAVQVAGAVLDRASSGAASIGAVKRVEDGEVPAGRQLVHRAVVPARPALLRGAVQVAGAVLDQAAKWVASIGAVKRVEDSEVPAGRQ